MMGTKFKTPVFLKGSKIAWAGAAMALMCGVAQVGALAQETGQQLPASIAQEQIPPAFPDSSDAAPQQAPQVMPKVAPAAQSQQASTDGVPVVPADEPPAEAVPSQPEQQRLVPSTPMGAAAQGAGTQVQAQENLPNPVEDVVPQQAPAMPNLLEQYANQSGQVASTQQTSQNGDALPQVNTMTAGTLNVDGTMDMNVDDGLSTQDNEALQEEIRTEAFDAAITGMFPLEPNQIKEVLKRYDATQEAAKTPVYEVPKPEISVQNISLDPGVLPPTIKTAVGNVTTLNILDATGAPWPVQDVTWAGDYEIVEPEEGGHIIRITPMSHFARGNIVIRLLTLKTPLTMTLETGRDVVQYRVDARVPEYGPFANAPLMQGGKSMVAGGSELTSILDGVAPGGAMKLTVSGVDGRTTAYSMGGTTYVRTPLTLLSPAWQSSVSSADGMNVYALSNAPVLLLSDGGEFTRAVLKEKEDLLDE